MTSTMVGPVERLAQYKSFIQEHPDLSLAPVLPLLFTLKGKPYDILQEHFPHEPTYKLMRLPRRSVIKAGRQVGKSTNGAAQQVLIGMLKPYLNLLYVTPLFEQVRKFSTNYVKPFMSGSRVQSRLVGGVTDNSVLQRTLPNQSNLFYNYASNSADRIRGTAADLVAFDEAQDMDPEIVPVILSCLGASPYKLEQYKGTPKTFNSLLQIEWEKSSQATWHIPCSACSKISVCRSVGNGGDLENMIGDGSRRKTDGKLFSLICPECGEPLNSRNGYYIHAFPERQLVYQGLHMPQVIFPMHYESAVAWSVIFEDIRTKPKYIVLNEIYGESCDVGSVLVSKEELENAGRKGKWRPPNKFSRQDYMYSAVGADWGGKGKEQAQDVDEFISNTAIALGGLRTDGVVEINWLYRTPYSMDHEAEARMVKSAFADAHADFLAHDFTGAGDIRETLLLQKGVPKKNIVPFTYSMVSLNKPIVSYTPPPPHAIGARHSFTLDKGRSLLLLVHLIKTGWVILPPWGNAADCLQDFMALYEDVVKGASYNEIRTVKRRRKRTDDVVHAINFVCMSLYHRTGRWPDVAKAYMELRGEDSWTPDDLAN